jgi:hypothetical protein
MTKIFIPLHSSIQNLTKCPEFKGFYLENKFILKVAQICFHHFTHQLC